MHSHHFYPALYWSFLISAVRGERNKQGLERKVSAVAPSLRFWGSLCTTYQDEKDQERTQLGWCSGHPRETCPTALEDHQAGNQLHSQLFD